MPICRSVRPRTNRRAGADHPGVDHRRSPGAKRPVRVPLASTRSCGRCRCCRGDLQPVPGGHLDHVRTKPCPAPGPTPRWCARWRPRQLAARCRYRLPRVGGHRRRSSARRPANWRRRHRVVAAGGAASDAVPGPTVCPVPGGPATPPEPAAAGRPCRKSAPAPRRRPAPRLGSDTEQQPGVGGGEPPRRTRSSRRRPLRRAAGPPTTGVR